MSDHQKNQKIISKSEFKDHLIQSLFYRKEDEDKERLNYLPKSTQLISRRPRYWSADSKPSLPSTMTFSDGGVPVSLPAKHWSQPVSTSHTWSSTTFTAGGDDCCCRERGQSSWKSSLGDSTTTTLPPECVPCPRGNHCYKELSIPSKKEKKGQLSLNDNTDSCGENSFLLSYIFFVPLGSLIPVQEFVEWLLFLLPDQSPIINYKKKKASHYYLHV